MTLKGSNMREWKPTKTRKEKIDFIFEWAGEEYETEEELIALAYSSNIRLNEIIVNIKDWYE
jgi:hypothetical protein